MLHKHDNTNGSIQDKKNHLLGILITYFPELIPAVWAMLAVFGAMTLARRTRPLTLIFEGPSGSGKTTVLQMAFPIKDLGLEELVYRSDKFTPKAFVTHAANISKDQLKKIDMLPRIEERVLIIKEMAPILRGRKEDLIEAFSILIGVLDGKGFVSDSGIQGRRGYDRPIIFNWLGATTPLPPNTYRLMSQLGNRLLFFEMTAVEPPQTAFVDFAKSDSGSIAEEECQVAVNEFLVEFFETHPVSSVPPETILIPDHLNERLVRWAMLLARGRAEIRSEKSCGEWEPVAALPCEAPYRVIEYFKELARGHALIDGRSEVNEEDLELITHIAISSMTGHLRPLVRELRHSEFVNTTRCKQICKVSAPTARSYMVQLSLMGISKLEKGSANESTADTITLTEEFKWLFRG